MSLVLALAVVLAIPTAVGDPGSVLTLVIAGLYGTVGAILAIRRPRNPIGWILLGIMLVFSISSAADALGGTAVRAGGAMPGGLPLLLIWMETWIFNVLFGLYYALTVVFPTGHLPGGRIGAAVRLSFLVPLAGIVVAAFGASLSGLYTPQELGRSIANPVGFVPFPEGLAALFTAATVVLLLAGVVSMLVRFGRAHGVEREQLKWLVASLALTGVLVLLVAVYVVVVPHATGVGEGPWLLALFGYASIPPAVGIAVLRYRLYEIDRIVSRTIGWATISLVLGSLFVLIVLVTQAALVSFTTANTLAVAVSTLVVAALFQPLRRWIQARVDRRFDRSRYDAGRVVDAFAGRLRDKVDLEQVGIEINMAVVRSVAPASVSLWLRR